MKNTVIAFAPRQESTKPKRDWRAKATLEDRSLGDVRYIQAELKVQGEEGAETWLVEVPILSDYLRDEGECYAMLPQARFMPVRVQRATSRGNTVRIPRALMQKIMHAAHKAVSDEQAREFSDLQERIADWHNR